jgi:hypothetical protein
MDMTGRVSPSLKPSASSALPSKSNARAASTSPASTEIRKKQKQKKQQKVRAIVHSLYLRRGVSGVRGGDGQCKAYF